MKVYKIKFGDRYLYKGGVFSDDNPMSSLDVSYMLDEKEIDINKWVPIKFILNCKGNRRGKIVDIMDTNVSDLRMVSERAQNLLKNKYDNFIRFLPIEVTDIPGLKYSAMIPSEYVEGLDMSRSVYELESPDKYVGIYDDWFISKYVFKDIIKSYPIFRLMQHGFNKRLNKEFDNYYSSQIYVLDEFVRFVAENNITGLEFEEIYDDSADNTTVPEIKKEPEPPAEKPQIRKTHLTETYRIPMEYRSGKYPLKKLDQSQDNSLVIKYDGCNMLSNNINEYTLYSLEDCDMPNDIEVTYTNGKLSSVYLNYKGKKLPVYLYFDFSEGEKPEALEQAINECISLCSEDFLNELEKSRKPLCSTGLEYYDLNVNLQDNDHIIYVPKDEASYTTECVCVFADHHYHRNISENKDICNDVFEKIVYGIYNRLSEEIPKRFEVREDFEFYEPEKYD